MSKGHTKIILTKKSLSIIIPFKKTMYKITSSLNLQTNHHRTEYVTSDDGHWVLECKQVEGTIVNNFNPSGKGR